MQLSRTQFDILTSLEREKDKKKLTQRDIAHSSDFSLGTVNKIMNHLNETGLVENNSITGKGIKALEPYRVKRAIFIAAGFGSRLVPITLNTPKPLVRVKGVRIIDTLLDAIVDLGIKEIIIVRGYLSEQFDLLKNKYPDIKFIENPIYNESNNISSMMYVRDLLQNTYILESDLLLANPSIITKYQYSSNYLGIPAERTDDWCFETRNGIITKVKVGGRNCHQMIGISYWNNTDGQKMSEHIKQVFEMPGGRERFWDLVPLEYFIKEYSVEVRECSFDDVLEIDTYKELVNIDKAYKLM